MGNNRMVAQYAHQRFTYEQVAALYASADANIIIVLRECSAMMWQGLDAHPNVVMIDCDELTPINHNFDLATKLGISV